MLKSSIILLSGLAAAGLSLGAMADSCASLNGSTWKGTFHTSVPVLANCKFRDTFTVTGAGSTYKVHVVQDKTSGKGRYASKCPRHEDFSNKLTCSHGRITTYMRGGNQDKVNATLESGHMRGSGSFKDRVKVSYDLDLQKQ